MTFRIPNQSYDPSGNTTPDSVTADAGLQIPLEKFVRGSTVDILGRPATEQEVDAWVLQLRSGISRRTLLKVLLTSVERRQQTVQAFFHLVLKHTATPGQVHFWSEKLESGTSQEDVLAQLIHSPEVQQVCGHKNEEFVRFLFKNLLNRHPLQAEVDAWVGLLDSFAANRFDVAQSFISSEEFRKKFLTKWLWGVFRAQPDDYFVEMALENLKQGYSIEAVQAEILGGKEYFNLKALAP